MDGPLDAEEILAVETYAGSQYRLINGCLRGDEPCTTRILTMIGAIDRAINRSRLPADLILFRGIGGDAAAAIRSSGIAVGSMMFDDAFMSTSIDPRTAGMFAQFPPGGLMLRIRAPKGMNALDMAPYSPYAREREFLLPRGTVLRVLGYNSSASELECEVVING